MKAPVLKFNLKTVEIIFTKKTNGRQRDYLTLQTNKSIRLSANTTVFQAEVIAIREATRKMLSTFDGKYEYIKILTDSQAALQALDDTTYASRAVKDTMIELNNLGHQVKRLELAWVKAHIGMPGYERADKLARDAEDLPDIDFHIAESWTHFKNLLEEKCYQKWTDRWLGENRFRLTKMFYPAPSKQKTKDFRENKHHYM